MKFYNVKTRQSVDVPDTDVEVITMKNGKLAAKATHNGTNLFKIRRFDLLRFGAGQNAFARHFTQYIGRCVSVLS